MRHLKTLFFVLLTLSNSLFAQEDCQNRKQRIIQSPAPLSALSVAASNLRSDTTDILHYTISLNITDFTSDTIRGNTAVTFHSRTGPISTLSLDLLRLKVDSIAMGGQQLAYTYNDTLLIVILPHLFQVRDTGTVAVYYHGRPSGDASGWGGFYFQNGYAYNLGVGFAANPHNYGRVWYPCFDNFAERATYTFRITTDKNNIAECNGLLAQDTTSASGLRTRTWIMNETIPSYLACVAVAPYVQVNMSFNSLSGPKPVVLSSLAADTLNLKKSFVHLPDAFAGFEKRYGPYRWDKIGYSMVPFSSGAMEHATNIAFPLLAANGSLTYEAQIMAHELSHHWFGDLVTCSNEGDMWLNEGWATYSQNIFLEAVYGYTAYINAVKANHENVLHYADKKEGGFLPVSGVPHNYTYGDHVYLKGADVAHTLRAYLGDTLFFSGLQSYLNTKAFSDASSTDFMNSLVASTGKTNTTDFFNDWVFNPGWPHFSIDSFQVKRAGSAFQVQVFIRQKLHGANHYFNQVPLEITFKDSMWNSIKTMAVVSGSFQVFSFILPFSPAYAGLNLGSQISDAITSGSQVLKSSASAFSISAGSRMKVTPSYPTVSTDSAWIRIEHNYTAPDPVKNNLKKYMLSQEHYWRVDGLFPAVFSASAQIAYDGRTNVFSGGPGFEDNGLLVSANLEDSIVLLYRPDRKTGWLEETGIVKTIGNPADKYGTIIIQNLRKGEYALALKGFTTGITGEVRNTSFVNIYPNPSQSEFNVRIDASRGDQENILAEVYDQQGRVICSRNVEGISFSLSAGDWAPGLYFLTLSRKGQPFAHSRLMRVN